jgi:sulfite exporter TauE/SafE
MPLVQVNDEMVNRMGEDERHIEAYFSESVKPLALAAQITQLRHLREILAGFRWGFVGCGLMFAGVSACDHLDLLLCISM